MGFQGFRKKDKWTVVSVLVVYAMLLREQYSNGEAFPPTESDRICKIGNEGSRCSWPCQVERETCDDGTEVYTMDRWAVSAQVCFQESGSSCYNIAAGSQLVKCGTTKRYTDCEECIHVGCEEDYMRPECENPGGSGPT